MPTDQQPDEISAEYSLSGRVVLVTGAGRGIGRSVATAFGNAGAHVVCVSRTKSEVEAVAATINALHAFRALPLVCDLSVISSIPALIQDIQAHLGKPVEILINNAGITRIDSLECHLDMEIWQRVLTTNLTSPVALICEILPTMLVRGGGTIISIGSRSSAFDIPYSSAYSVSKTALLKFHQNIESEVGQKGIRSYYLQPGNIRTSILDGLDTVDDKSYRRVEGVRQTVSQIMDSPKVGPERVADACIALATAPESALLSGRYIDLDGDIGRLLDDLSRGSSSECVQRSLHKLKVDTL
ncbi:hypothetical protein F5Y19DRAFT_478250 [Xylariaceae sp. FL1651]|nr:hypothetical protein F5Y19DRAFT_478250 [Xylariaceae sp. FL1651]